MRRRLRPWVAAALAGEEGLSLVETVIAVALLGLVGGALLLGLSAATLGTGRSDQQNTASSAARSQLESVKAQVYSQPPAYATIVPPPGFTVGVTGSAVTSGVLEVITTTVSAGGVLAQVAAYKANLAARPTPAATPLPTTIAWDDFESGGWSGGGGWLGSWAPSGDASIATTGSPYQGGYHLRLRQDTGYVERAANLSGQTGLRWRFWAKADSFGSGDTAVARVSPNYIDWYDVYTWAYEDSDGAYHFIDIDLSPYAMTSQFWFALDANMSGTGDYLYVDDLRVVRF